MASMYSYNSLPKFLYKNPEIPLSTNSPINTEEKKDLNLYPCKSKNKYLNVLNTRNAKIGGVVIGLITALALGSQSYRKAFSEFQKEDTAKPLQLDKSSEQQQISKESSSTNQIIFSDPAHFTPLDYLKDKKVDFFQCTNPYNKTVSLSTQPKGKDVVSSLDYKVVLGTVSLIVIVSAALFYYKNSLLKTAESFDIQAVITRSDDLTLEMLEQELKTLELQKSLLQEKFQRSPLNLIEYRQLLQINNQVMILKQTEIDLYRVIYRKQNDVDNGQLE
jgi:hypothetical protein